jgi:lysophospholipase L1-like esterase
VVVRTASPIKTAGFLLALTVGLGAGMTASQTPAERIRIVLVGDSTVAEAGGWGPGLRAAFGSGIEVVNFALNGRSSKSFLNEGAWALALAAKPHFVLIQFGHNDVPGKGPDRETDPATTYRANLTRYVGDARAIGATPILVTSIVRRNLTPAGKVQPDSLVPYVAAVRAIAKEHRVPLMDLYERTREQCERLGRAGCNALGTTTAAGTLDTTHLGPTGQREIGALASREFLRVVCPSPGRLSSAASQRDSSLARRLCAR